MDNNTCRFRWIRELGHAHIRLVEVFFEIEQLNIVTGALYSSFSIAVDLLIVSECFLIIINRFISSRILFQSLYTYKMVTLVVV